MNKIHSIVTFIVGIIFIFGPLTAMAFGSRAKPIENRPLSSAPSLSDGWDIFDTSTDYLVDRLTIRPQSVRYDAWVDINIFNENPSFGQSANPEVIIGRNGWLFLAGELSNACFPGLSSDDVVNRWDRLVRIISASGRKVALAIPPDKSTVYPEMMPLDSPNWECAETNRKELWDRLDPNKVAGLLPLHSAIDKAKVATREILYHRMDTHWNTVGSTVMIQEIIKSLAPELWFDEDVKDGGRSDYYGDLTSLMGAQEKDKSPGRNILRPGVEEKYSKDATLDGGSPVIISENTTHNERDLLPGKTLLVYDSFGDVAIESFRPFVKYLTAIQWFNSSHSDMIDKIEESNTVVLESVERGIHFRAQSWLTDEFLKSLEERLSQ